MSLRDIVKVDITDQSITASSKGFGVINVMGVHKAFTGVYKEYAVLGDVLNDFLSTDPEYLAAQACFSQTPSVEKIGISRRETGDTTVCTVVTVEDSTNYSVIINGEEFEITSDSDATAEEIAAALKIAVDAGSEPVTFTDNLDGTYDIDPVVPTTLYTIAVDTNQSKAFTLSNTPAEDLVIISEDNDTWYGLIYTIRDSADVLLTAAYIEGVKKVFANASSDVNIIDQSVTVDTTTIAAKFKSLGYVRSLCLYAADTTDYYLDASALASVLPLNPGSWFLKFNTCPGIPKDKLTTTQRTNVLAKYCNIYTEGSSVGIIENGTVGAGNWFDIVVLIDWLEARISEAVYILLIKHPKLPFTNDGIIGVGGEVESVLQLAQSPDFQGIAPDDGAGGPGYTIKLPTVAEIPDADKIARVLKYVSFSAILSGAVGEVNITGTVGV